MKFPAGWISSLATNGFVVLPRILEESLIQHLIDAIENSPLTPHQRRESTYARRNLLSIPAVQSVAAQPAILTLVENVLGRGCRAVRAIFFDKTPQANWTVPWHQDLSIAVKERADLRGYGPWSIKAGIVHVQPPRDVLDRMLTIRLHLDSCGSENGPLKVIPGSHAHGALPADEIARRTQTGHVTECAVPRGGALLMRPLLLHASSPAFSPSHRRVVHIEFCNADLPAPLAWA
jgi:ectoine hydroxylase-related dioxygenase (phytanoyl-CoA dioxygenase family)